MKSRTRRIFECFVPWLLMLAGWLYCFWPTLRLHIRRTLHPSVLSDDMRIQLAHLYRLRDSALFPNDPIGKYHADGTGELWRWLYAAAAPWIDIVEFGKLLTYVCLLLTLAGIAVAASSLAGRAAAFAAVGLSLGTFVFIDRVGGGLPRSFAYPCLAWAAACLVTGRIRSLALISVLGAGFYPLIPVVCGLALAVVLLLLSPRDRGSARRWTLRHRLAVLAVTLVGSAALIAPFALRMQPYGAVIRASDVKEFPEIGPNGRVGVFNRPPSPPFVELAGVSQRTLLATTRPFVPSLFKRITRPSGESLRNWFADLLAVVTLFGVARLGLQRRGRRTRRLAALAVATVAGFLLAELVTPSLVLGQRYVRFGVPILTAIVVPSAALGLLPRRLRLPGRLARWTSPTWVFVYGLLLLALMGGRFRADAGATEVLDRRNRATFRAIRKLPPDAVIAGWPNGALENVPLVARRAAFITGELYMPYHKTMTLQMRERARAVIRAYFSPDRGPLLRLRDEYGVTHFLLEPKSLRKPPPLFAPLDADLKQQRAALNASGLPNALDADFGAAVVHRDGGTVLLDLSKL
jgi:hypothetical protein